MARPGLKAGVWDRGRWRIQGDLIQTATEDIDEVRPGAVSAGWQRLDGHHPLSVTAEGQFTGTVTVYLSNGDDPGADGPGTDYPFAGTPILDGPQSIEISRPYQWVKAVVSNLTAGAVRRVSVFGAGMQQ